MHVLHKCLGDYCCSNPIIILRNMHARRQCYYSQLLLHGPHARAGLRSVTYNHNGSRSWPVASHAYTMQIFILVKHCA